MSDTFGPPPGDEEYVEINTTPRQPQLEMADGVYRIRLAGVRVVESKFDGNKESRIWEFEPKVDNEWKPGRLFFYSSVSTGPRIEEVFKALKIPYEKAAKTRVNLNEFYGRECSGVIQNAEGKSGGKFPRLKNLLAA